MLPVAICFAKSEYLWFVGYFQTYHSHSLDWCYYMSDSIGHIIKQHIFTLRSNIVYRVTYTGKTGHIKR